MSYDLKDPRQEQLENISATYYLAEVLPLDVAYSLNPQEDKIAGYHQEEVSEKHAGRSHNEMVLRVVFSLLESKFNYDNYIELIKNNSDLSDFANRLEKFINILSSGGNDDESHQNLAYRLKSLDELDPELLTQVGEIRNAKIFTLLKYALPGIGSKEKGRFKNDHDEAVEHQDKSMLRRVVFEARRKLAMLFLLLETDEYYDDVIDVGTQEIQELRRKERESLYRKMIVRGFDGPEDVKDIHGRSLVITPTKDRALNVILKKEERVIEVCGKDGNGNMLCEDKNFEDHAAVFEIIENLQKDKHVKILEYKPTNESNTALNYFFDNFLNIFYWRYF